MKKSPPFTAESVPDLRGKTALVTGANSGLGYEISLVLAKKGARLVFAARDQERGRKAVEALKQAVPGADVELRLLDLADLDSIRSFASEVFSAYKKLDFLFNNAGVMAIPQRTTKQGFEMQLGTNHLGHFALTGLLLSVLKSTPGARVITTSSFVHRFGKMDFDDLDGLKKYKPWKAYYQSKLANLLFAYELQRKLAAAGSSLISVACHPGYSVTNLQAVGPEMKGSAFERNMTMFFTRLVAQPAAQGALTALRAAVDPELKGGEFIGEDGFMSSRGNPVIEVSSKKSYDLEAAKKLWEISAARTGVVY